MRILIASTWCLAAYAGASLPPIVTDDGRARDALVSRLASDSLVERDVALKHLSSIALTPAELCGMIQKATSPEQRARLALLGPETMRRTPRGALGVRFSQDDSRATVLATLEGFDSQRALKSGDVILSIDGEAITNQYTARPAIISHDPGQEIEIQVLRAGRVVTTRVKLGDFESLNKDEPAGFRNAIAMSAYERAWACRITREQAGSTTASNEPIGGAVTQEQWSRLAESGSLHRNLPTPISEQVQIRSAWIDPPVARESPAGPMVRADDELTAGGEARGTTEAASETARRVNRIFGSRGKVDPVADFKKRQANFDRLGQVMQELANAKLTPDERAKLERELRDLQSAMFADVNGLRGDR